MITDTIQQLMTLFMLIAIELEFDTLKSSNYVSIIQLLGVLANRHLPLLLIAAVVSYERATTVKCRHKFSSLADFVGDLRGS